MTLTIDELEKAISELIDAGIPLNTINTPFLTTIKFKSGEEIDISYGDYLEYIIMYDESPSSCKDVDEFIGRIMALKV